MRTISKFAIAICTVINKEKGNTKIYMKITIVGAGYVGLSLATLLSQNNEVIAIDINQEKVDMINKRISPIKDKEIEEFFFQKRLNLVATSEYREAFLGSEFIIVCTPTDYNEIDESFDTSSVEDIIKKVIDMNIDTTLIIKSTIPIGFVNEMRKKYNTNNIIFSPEFLREGKALHDNLYPSRIIIGDKGEKAHEFANLLKDSCLASNVPIKYMDANEAEAVKLFANTYLALRISYFNELDTYAEEKGLNAKDIIEGVCLDPRIGDYYNNPSFGYGGYCLPKDTKQLLANYEGISQNIISATVYSNESRKNHIANTVMNNYKGIIGIYKLAMKSGSDNFRSSSIQGIIEKLKENNYEVIIYDPMLYEEYFNNCKVVKDFEEFLNSVDVILANRVDEKIVNTKKKVYTRDLFSRD